MEIPECDVSFKEFVEYCAWNVTNLLKATHKDLFIRIKEFMQSEVH